MSNLEEKSRKQESSLSKNTKGVLLISLAIALASSFSLSTSKNHLRTLKEELRQDIERPPLYLPNGKYIRLVTMGYNNFASDILWFQTINYFGKQLRGTKDYKWLEHMCDLVVDLDKKKFRAYEFCANMLAWEAKDFVASEKLLSSAIKAFPNHWRFWYLRGFTNWYFLGDKEKAQKDLEQAATLENAPAFLASLASRLMVDTKNPETAISFLENMRNNAKDDDSKSVFDDKLKRAYMAQHIRELKRLVTQYEEQFSRKVTKLKQLVEGGLPQKALRDPFGGTYVLLPETGEILSNTGEQPLQFFGKTKDTGIFHMENS